MHPETFYTRIESILDRELSLGHTRLRLVGCNSSSALAVLLANSSSEKIDMTPHFIVFSKHTEAVQFVQNLNFFNSQRQTFVFPPFDVSPFEGLYPKPQTLAERGRFLFQAQNAKPGQIFVTSIGTVLQKTLPLNSFASNVLKLTVGDELPRDFFHLLLQRGYQQAPITEGVGQFCQRGGLIDVFSPAHDWPVRIELFGDSIQSFRFFNPATQISEPSSQTSPLQEIYLIPAREIIWHDDRLDHLISHFRKSVQDRPVDSSELEEAMRSISRSTPFDGIDFLLPLFYDSLASVMDHFTSAQSLWLVDPMEIQRQADQFIQEMKEEYANSSRRLVRPEVSDLFYNYDEIPWPKTHGFCIELASIDTNEDLSGETQDIRPIPYKAAWVTELSQMLSGFSLGSDPWMTAFKSKLKTWSDDDYKIFVSVRNRSQGERLRVFFDKIEMNSELVNPDAAAWESWMLLRKVVHIIPRPLYESVRLVEEKILLLREEDFFGKKTGRLLRGSPKTSAEEVNQKIKHLSFGDLKPGDCVVHVQHGIGLYEGLRVMNVGGADSEFIQIAYKDKDKLYLPVYRIGQLQKYSGAAATTILDKLGGASWEKTKTKVQTHLKSMASELLKLYALRASASRPCFHHNEDDFMLFQSTFPYDETEDQLRAISDIVKDLTGTKPMDRLICGDVGFGKTEVSMRAAFLAAKNNKQVAVLAPTTVLSFQHYETFKKRFSGWNFNIRELNRFVSPPDVKKTIKDLKDGRVDIVIGTHRLLSKDIEFNNLGLLIVDEEQKFGVSHKERIKKLRAEVDTLSMSATPIPRTLNMSLMGIRDLSFINTAPVDRVPTRTFTLKWNTETIQKAIRGEVARGGQVYFIHNRVQSIYGLADELKALVPEVRVKVAHGQMDEEKLESTMVQFFNHEVDVLLCTSIVESGMDVPKANTMFIDQAHIMGLSQLYQLRGRVGRSNQRAYCYLLLPRSKKIEKEAQERLRVIQENTALGSGISIAQYDLELRGAGNLLGEEQSGYVDAVGYELYMDLLNESIQQLRGQAPDEIIDPEINLRIPALIPDSYISDIRQRLSYYKALADIRSTEDLDKIEAELKDQFGEPPEPTQNLMGLMLIRAQCKHLGIKDLSAGTSRISLLFSEKNPMKTEDLVKLAIRETKKYTISPDCRLYVRMKSLTWPAVYEELQYLSSLAGDFS